MRETGTRDEESGEATVLRVTGPLDRERAAELWDRIRRRPARDAGKPLILDMAGATAIDSTGVALVRKLGSGGAAVSVRDAPPAVAEFLRFVGEQEERSEENEGAPGEAAEGGAGAGIRAALAQVRLAVAFAGTCAVEVAALLLRPGRLRADATLVQVARVGWGALPLLCLMSFLMGMIMVFQGVATVTSFGASIYLADMVVVAVTREMAPLLTGVIMAGRSGASFAAELGSMEINKELDALEVMNFSIVRYLVIPRLLAIFVAGPLLTAFADASGILGGMVTTCAIVRLPAIGFLDEVRKALNAPAIYTGLVKGAGFGLLIGFTGCFRGLAARRSPDSVGIETTAAVVWGILLMIFADAFFSAIFHFFGW